MRRAALVSLLLSLAACSGGKGPAAAPEPAPPDLDGSALAAARVTILADSFVAGFFRTQPEQGTARGWRFANHAAVTDNSLAARERWRLREDAWLAELRQVDATRLAERPERFTYGILRGLLEDAAAERVCRYELWNLNPVTGWQASYASLARLQPVGSDSLRAAALARARGIGRFIDTERGNLAEGLRGGFVAPRPVVEVILRQLDALLATPAAQSPFASPAQRDSTPGFREALVAAVADSILPAMRRYREYLAGDYLPRARSEIGVSASPGGEACYRASVRRFTTLGLPPSEIFERGQRELARIEQEMRTLAERRFGTSDVPALLRRLRDDTAFTFHTRQEIVDSSEAAIARATKALPRWFGILPGSGVIIEQHPEFRQRAGAVAQYNPPADDGSRPGIFYITTYQPEHQSRAMLEPTAFHEAVPGHHLQVTIAVERNTIHPLGRYLFNSGYAEGWGLYAERLADEMKLYSSDVDRMGMLAAQAMRASRLVVDSGLHTMAWSREQAIDYMLSHTTEDRDSVAAEIDRYIIWPGQATSYMLGMLEIRKARDEAQARLGSRFDIKAFHDRVLEDGSVPLSYLSEKIRVWSSP